MTANVLPLHDGGADWHVPADTPVAPAGRLPDGTDPGRVSRFGDDMWDLAPTEDPLPTVGEEDEGLWWLHFTDGAQGPFPSAQAAWDYWHGNPPPLAGGGGEGRA